MRTSTITEKLHVEHMNNIKVTTNMHIMPLGMEGPLVVIVVIVAVVAVAVGGIGVVVVVVIVQ